MNRIAVDAGEHLRIDRHRIGRRAHVGRGAPADLFGIGIVESQLGKPIGNADLPAQRKDPAEHRIEAGCRQSEPAGEATSSPARSQASRTAPNKGRCARPASLTMSGRAMPSARAPWPTSAIRPAPKRIVVG